MLLSQNTIPIYAPLRTGLDCHLYKEVGGTLACTSRSQVSEYLDIRCHDHRSVSNDCIRSAAKVRSFRVNYRYIIGCGLCFPALV